MILRGNSDMTEKKRDHFIAKLVFNYNPIWDFNTLYHIDVEHFPVERYDNL